MILKELGSYHIGHSGFVEQRECAEHCLVRLDWDRNCSVIDIIVVYVVALAGSATS